MANTLPASDGARFAANGNDPSRTTTRFWALTIGSVGVVYGDIGTSPLYAFRESLRATGDSLAPADVLGILSLIFWALMIVVTLKYVIFLIRADNRGEGGTLALMALAQRAFGHTAFLVALGITAAALFYGDAVITPALSVLSAVEGLEIVAPDLQHWILPLSAAILVGLFVVQSRGTATVSALFGPVTVVWFVVLAVLGVVHVADNPGVLAALNPLYAARFLGVHGFAGLFTLGAVFLAVTGAEALYADLGHFGRRPIQTAWLGLVIPALTLNYLGQGALVLGDPAALASPFFLMAPAWAQLPLVILATAATIIASQAVITGAYSLTRQAIQLGLLPRLEIRHTSETHAGQIYMPRVNWLLLAGVLLLVVLFRSSGALANAYGIAVTGTMVVTTILAFIVVRRVWGWSAVLAGLLVLPFLFVDLSFLFANMLKIVEGGWFPLLLGALVVTIMVTWRRGTRVLFDKTRRLEIPLAEMVARLERSPPHRMKGTAIFLTSDPESTPTALLHSLKHFGVLHDMNVILTIVTADTPRVSPENAVTLEQFSPSFARIFVRSGFMETPNIPGALATARRLGFTYDIMTTSFFLSRRTLKIAAASAMPRWQDRLFRMLARTADDASAYFRIPSDRVVEIGTQMTV